METIQLPWPVSKLDEASLNIAATLEAVGEAVDAVPTENADLVRRGAEGCIAVMQKIAARSDFGGKKESYTKPVFRKVLNQLVGAAEKLDDDIDVKTSLAILAGHVATTGMPAVSKCLAKMDLGDALDVFVPPCLVPLLRAIVAP